MAKRGRKRKNAARTKSGAISRAKPFRIEPDRVPPTERAQAMQVLYGQDGCDAIGRAYRSGLLGTGNEAKKLLDTARKLSNAYWQAYETGKITCTLGGQNHGSLVDLDHERIRRREEWLHECRQCIMRMGRDVYRAFEQLCIDPYPDHGPQWLDDLIYADRHGKPQDIADVRMLRKALDGLELVAE